MIFIIWVLSFKAKGGSTPEDDSTSPMLAVYAEQPDFSLYTNIQSGDKFLVDFWKQPNYGGPVYEPIRRTVDEETEVIDNGLRNVLNDVHATRGERNGLFSLRNLK